MKLLKGWRTIIFNLLLVIAGAVVQFTGVAAPDAMALIQMAVDSGAIVVANSSSDVIDFSKLQELSGRIGDSMGYAMMVAGAVNGALRLITDTKVGQPK